MAGCIACQLPAELAGSIAVYSAAAGSGGGADDAAAGDADVHPGDADVAGDLDSGIAAAAGRVKQRGAAEFVARMSDALRDKDGAAGVSIGPGLGAAGGAPGRTVSPAWLSAVAATLGAPSSGCVLVASSGELIAAGTAAGMLALAVPRKMAGAASYPTAAAKFECGFGPGAATWRKASAVWATRCAAASAHRQHC